MTEQLNLSPPRRPRLVICDPSSPGGRLVLRVALDASTPAYWEVVGNQGRLGPGRLRAALRSSGATTEVKPGDTLISTSADVRREWTERLTAAGWEVVRG